ncbi:hypothetical protein GOBAR_AA18215 [Gossypium barbadense]|uniref:Uncharacterized protein n=1 Tax=Gossypium barbadense TaxID=3634 RepID=A0A2P5XGJ6_GOSBA|nr:hypothetical protein GOBAR_AA18215 [Gossypium barbadense]
MRVGETYGLPEWWVSFGAVVDSRGAKVGLTGGQGRGLYGGDADRGSSDGVGAKQGIQAKVPWFLSFLLTTSRVYKSTE